MRPALRLAFFLLLSFSGAAQAVEVKVLESDTIEMRNLQIPGGDSTVLYIFTGSPVRLEVDGDLIIAERIEFDNASRMLRIIGAGDVSYDDVATKGRNYLLDMGSGDLAFEDVFIFTEPLDVKGVQAIRQPGQIDVTAGAFSPCSRCAQDVQDYRFTAERMNLYPGDRLVAFNVTVYIRDLPSFFLPLMVVPLGPADRQPRLQIQRGSETERAEVALDWPYVFGANALGTVSLRYFADVDPGLSSNWAENVFGGTIIQNYFGGGFEHRFYTERGQGNLDFFYTPSFLEYSGSEASGNTRDEYQLDFGYATEEALEGLQTEILLERDDANNQRILNLTARASDSYGGFDFNYVTQTYFDLDLSREDEAETPAYRESEGALRTYVKLQASQSDDSVFSVGPFSLTNLLLEAGVFEDYANTSNVSATTSPLYINDSPIIRSGRLVGGQTLTLEAISPFSGASLSGSTDFLGQYYTTTNSNGELERLIDWNTLLSFDQTFGAGSFGVDYTRTILEGESPFGFDTQSTPANRTDLASEFLYSPLEWLDLSVSETYVFQDDREGDEIGAGPLETRVELFSDLDWFSATLEQRFDIQENDPGLLGASATFTLPDSSVNGSLNLSGAYDLSQTQADRLGVPINESEADLAAQIGYETYAALDVSVGYDFNGDPDDFGDYGYGGGYSGGYGSSFGSGGGIFDEDDTESDLGEQLYKPLELGLTLGTLEQEDALPGLRAAMQRDVNTGATESIGLEAAARLGPIEISADQAFDFDNRDASDSEFNVTVPDIIEFSGVGFGLLPPSLVGLVPDPEDTVSYGLSLADLTQQDTTKLYELSYETSYGPLDEFGGSAAGLGFSNTSLTAQVAVPLGFIGTGLGPLGFGLRLSSILAIADDELLQTYLSSGNLTLTTDFFSTVALQGTLAYAANSFGDTELSSQSLTFTDFGVTVRLWEDLYLSALLDDTWEFINPSATTTPYNFQPLFYLTLDRCCWAFYAAYNTENGTVSLTLGYPGSETSGITGAFNTGLYLPRREFQ